MENLKKNLPYIAIGAAALGTAYYIYSQSSGKQVEEIKLPKQ
jgi:hypothetical protein